MSHDDIYDHLINCDTCVDARAFVLTAVQAFLNTTSSAYEYAGYRYFYGETIKKPQEERNSNVREMYRKRSPLIYASSYSSIFILSGQTRVLTIRYLNDFFFEQIKDEKVAHTMTEMFARQGLVETKHRTAYSNVVPLNLPAITL